MVVKTGHGLLDIGTLKVAVLQEPINEMGWFFACWYKFRKAKSYFNNDQLCMVKNGEALEVMGLLNQVHLTNDLMNWADWLNDFLVMKWFLVWPPFYSVSLTFILYWLFPCGSQSSQIILKNFILKFLRNMIKLPSLR